ncbi:pelargonidin 3-O-(6-caffeoylglucoside) 5-O-(6-O-malonylglucoside) 4'''-malonyltransferase-like [Cornus florida]|uniref:pelargonidin 3-O-(6-caffeoylglucoside) 5-O-(6-O-malonylglucoside) 4'''-malonyltransferase-like n=1 Tax=Cornus florida TaxID=4283 RepID=UPI00289DB4FA|nr:pelargonidin 3-O-(6-caffeoylglucoside) 5-O-(6-O-malonylglucoside) 4'''-malonyltransferase-like [Cornus florida]
MEVQILSRKLIKPSSPTPDHLRTYKLSFFDQLAPPAHVPFFFFYSARAATNTAKDINIHKQLETSLSQTLTRFYPLAGRYIKDELLIDCNDEGVAYLEAHANCELSEIVGERLPIHLADHSVPRDIGAATLVTSPIVGIQVTRLKCGGGVTSMPSFFEEFFPSINRKEKLETGTNQYCKFDSETPTMFTSSLYFASLIASSIASVVTREIGRRWSMLFGGFLFCAGAISMASLKMSYLRKATMEVQILSRKLIKPSSPTPDHLRTYKLSFFDQLAPLAHVPFLFFYTAPAATNTAKDINIHKQLETSLSQTLTRFYPLAGRYIKDELLIDCNDEGVAYLEAQVNCELSEIVGERIPTRLVDHFVPRDIGAATLATSPIVGIQVTLLKCGGIVLTVHASHIIADGFTMSTFVHEWAITNGLDDTSKVLKWPSFDLAALFPARDLSGVLKPQPPPKNTGSAAKIVTRNFVFEGKTISDLKAKCMLEVGGGGTEVLVRQPSKLEVVTALIWRVLINVARAKHGQLRDSVVSIPVGLRGRTGVVTPECSFGNFYMLVPIKFKSDTSNMELHDLVGLVGNTIQKNLTDFAKITSGDDVFSNVIKFVNEIREGMCDENVEVRSFTSMSKFPVYEADFGWGKPSRTFGSVNMPFELFSLLDTKCGTGIEAWVSLNEVDMLKFECDPDILTFTFSPK